MAILSRPANARNGEKLTMPVGTVVRSIALSNNGELTLEDIQEVKRLTGLDIDQSIEKTETKYICSFRFQKDSVFRNQNFSLKSYPTRSGKKLLVVTGEGAFSSSPATLPHNKPILKVRGEVPSVQETKRENPIFAGVIFGRK
jgi:hypothetical protein